MHSVEPAVQENGDDAGEGRDGKEAEPGSPRRCDIIVISGRKEKCEAAKEALEVRSEPHHHSHVPGGPSAGTGVGAGRESGSSHLSPSTSARTAEGAGLGHSPGAGLQARAKDGRGAGGARTHPPWCAAAGAHKDE